MGPLSPLPQLLVPGDSGSRSRRLPRRARFLRQRRALWSPRVGLTGPRCPGLEAPPLGGEAGCADPGSGSAWVASLPCPVQPRSCEVPDPQKSELRNPSKVLRIAPGLGRVREATGSPHVWTPHRQFVVTWLPGLWGRYTGHVGAPFTPHPVAIEGNFASSQLACLLTRSISAQGKGGWGLPTLRVLGVTTT